MVGKRGSHKFAEADEPSKNPRPKWENDTTCAASEKDHAGVNRSVHGGAEESKQEKRSNDWKRVHKQDA